MTATEIRGLLVIGLGTAVVPLDASVNVAFPQIAAHFGLDIPSIRFVVISYVLIYASLTLGFGRIGDLVGYRRVFLLGCLISTAAFVLCTFAPSFAWFLAGRVTQGVAAALILSVGPALATGMLGDQRRAEALGWYSMMMAVAAVVGPMLAGVLLERFGWSSVFAFRIPIAGAALALGFTLPLWARPGSGARFDAAGGLLLAVTIGALVLTLDRLRGLPDAALPMLGAAALTAASLLAFIWRQGSAASPIIRLPVLREGDVARINIANILGNLATFAGPLLIPFYLGRFGGVSVAISGVLLAFSPIGSVLATPVAGRLASRMSSRILAQIGIFIVAASLVAIILAGGAHAIGWLVVAMFVHGIGAGLFAVAVLDILTASLPVADRGVAGSLGMVTRTIGTLTGASVLMLVFQASENDFITGFQHGFAAAALSATLAGLVLFRWTRQG